MLSPSSHLMFLSKVLCVPVVGWGCPTCGLRILASPFATQYVTAPMLETMGLREVVLFMDFGQAIELGPCFSGL